MPPSLDRIDHIHVYVADRTAAERWYQRVLGLERVAALAFWADEPGGPLIIADSTGAVCLSLFERAHAPCRSTIALGVSGEQFYQWQNWLMQELPVPPRLEDHQVAWSLYFSDPDDNPFEITTYDRAMSPVGA
ncbi:VOC family protein [Kushneria indalinina]|uniref:Catechol 2,3-dioxygenase-like lactoylglutathione lyase family enzyme n=1 Tax=Kushneria indalinina DSM 14324 TaxID=1122140 RepID=A0A3D9DY66_9GAMM|nr:VOC family protein [Kushneria indalinina]REC95299.1 catechol 2,3-dioxygenase-like lactoylglutathione lyase family enzyme [Kushneria indalinina DSM 14324]